MSEWLENERDKEELELLRSIPLKHRNRKVKERILDLERRTQMYYEIYETTPREDQGR